MRKGFAFASAMRSRGVYIHPWHNMFLNAAMTQDDIAFALDAAEQALNDLRRNAQGLPPNEKLAFLAGGDR